MKLKAIIAELYGTQFLYEFRAFILDPHGEIA